MKSENMEKIDITIYLKKNISHLVSRFACNTRVIIDASSNPPVSNVKSL